MSVMLHGLLPSSQEDDDLMMETGLQSPPMTNPLPSSPPRPIHRKQKKPPPITPRSFTRFFTPRSTLEESRSRVRTSRSVLEEITSSALNVSKKDQSAAKSQGLFGGALVRNGAATENMGPSGERKRKLSMSSMSTFSSHSTPNRRVRIELPPPSSQSAVDIYEDVTPSSPLKAVSQQKRPLVEAPKALEPVRKSAILNRAGGQFMRSISSHNHLTIRADMGADWRDETRSFYSDADSVHACVSQANPNSFALPFCSTACNTNSLVAVGDEEGGIRLLETAQGDSQGFAPAFLTWRPHNNAIMDMSFSSDDTLLATASGDQTTVVIDMHTRTSLMCLTNHTSSVKEVHFQPGSNNNVIATCSRDGTVSMWDLRCKGVERPSLQIRCSLETEETQIPQQGMKYPPISNCIRNAHKPLDSNRSQVSLDVDSGTAARRNPQRVNEVSVTSMTFLPAGREHFLVTGSECNASVKLWDIRANYNHRIRRAQPLSSTREPDSHKNHRHFGLTSVIANSDGSRLYTVCRDSSVYAYSTSHLILGHSPEMSASTPHTRVSVAGQDKDGLGPIFGFRHPRLQVTTFYIKAAIRAPTGNKAEMLAVGSSNACPIVFPTDEKLFRSSLASQGSNSNMPTTPVVEMASPAFGRRRADGTFPRPSLPRTNSGILRFGRRVDTIPIYDQGSALVEGHKKEVSSVSWTRDGDLVTVSDDYHARCWRQDETGTMAKSFRTAGNDSGAAWKCGWTDVDEDCDMDDDEGDIEMMPC